MKYLIIFLLLLPSLVSSQNKKRIDSLLIEVNKYQKPDTFRINALVSLANEIFYYNPDTAIVLSQQSIDLSKQLNNHRLSAAYTGMGLAYAEKENDSIAIIWYKKAIAEAERVNDKYTQARALLNMAISNDNSGKYKESLLLKLNAAQLGKELSNDNLLIYSYNSIGASYTFLDDYNNAELYYLKALPIAEKKKDTFNLISIFQNLGIINRDIARYDKAEKYYEDALQLSKARNDEKQSAAIYQSLGILKSNQKKNEEAIEWYKKAYSINTKLDYKMGMMQNLCNWGIELTTLKRYKEASEKLLASLELNKVFNNAQQITAVYKELSEVVLNCPDSVIQQMGYNPANRYTIAIDFANKALKVAKETEQIGFEADAYKNLGIAYGKLGNYQLAYENTSRAFNIHDSLTSYQQKKDIAQLEANYEIEKNEAAHSLKIQKEKEIKQTIIIGSILALLIVIVSFVFYKKRRDAIQLQNELIAKAKISDTEMKILRLQMNPHFIFNALNSIADYVRKNDAEQADYYLTKFSKLMRGILENSEEKEISLQEELKISELYMQLEAARLNNAFTYKINIDNDIDAAHTFIPPLILQPFIENAIWHGLANKKEGGHILIHISKQNLLLNCIVEDNGVGRINASKSNNKKSYGIKLTKERIAMLNKFKKVNASVNLIDLSQGTRAELQLPIENDNI